ncbi:MAG: MerR family transcriptional regulator [Lachnospiraceae bacterium]
MFKIGEFSKLVRVSPRMLRHWEKCGLIYPAEIDKYTGYRQYSAKQIPLVSSILMLRDVDFSLDEIADILPHMDDFAYMNRILRAKADCLQLSIEAQQAKLNRLIEMSGTMRKERNIMIFEVELKKIPSVKVISLRGIIPKYNEEGILWERLGRFIGEKGITCHSDGYSTYFDEAYKEENPDVEIAIPVDALGESEGDFIYQEYEEIPLAATLCFTGAFDGGYDAASEKLARWMEENDYAFAGNLRGHVLVSPDDEPNSERWKTELQVPVVKR